MEAVRNVYKVDLKRREHSGDLDVDEMIILEWTVEKYDGRVWTGFTVGQ
jgi:hypothetical protein